ATCKCMLVQVGRRNSSDEVVDLLTECHGRIRRFLVMTRALLDAPPGTPQAEIAATAGQIGRYFTTGFRLHVEDEEVEIAPRIAREAAAQLRVDHGAHVHDVAELVAGCSRLVRHPD